METIFERQDRQARELGAARVLEAKLAEIAALARKQAFLEDAEMAEEAAETCIRGQKSVLLALAERIRAKAAE